MVDESAKKEKEAAMSPFEGDRGWLVITADSQLSGKALKRIFCRSLFKLAVGTLITAKLKQCTRSPMGAPWLPKVNLPGATESAASQPYQANGQHLLVNKLSHCTITAWPTSLKESIQQDKLQPDFSAIDHRWKTKVFYNLELEEQSCTHWGEQTIICLFFSVESNNIG